jgi:tRNA 2-thiouridine synthesizing protein A
MDTSTEITGMLKQLDTRLSTLEKSLDDIKSDVSITARLDPEAKQAMHRLADFFYEMGGELDAESFEALVRQSINSICESGGQMPEQFIDADVSLQSTVILDTRGLNCPMPTLRTMKAIKQLAPGEVLQVNGTDLTCRKGIISWCERSGNPFLGEREGDGYQSFFIRKGQ